MKNKLLLSVLIICICIVTSGVFASSQVKTITVDIPKRQGIYTSSQVSKDYKSDQKFYHISTISNHDASKTNIQVRLYNVDYDTYGPWTEMGTGENHTFSGAFQNTGNYKIQIKNVTSSKYTYYTAGNWQYSI